MKISTTKDGTVSFTQMTADTAMLLVDLASDLMAGATLEHVDGRRFASTEVARTELAKIAASYDKPTTNIRSRREWDDFWTEV